MCAADATNCTSVQYQVSDKEEAKDRVCNALAVCKDDEWMSKPETLTADRTCTKVVPCTTATHYESKAKGVDTINECTLLRVCGPDENEAVKPTSTTDRECAIVDDCIGQVCGDGTCKDLVRSHRCDCNPGSWGARCDCTTSTYSLSLTGYGSPCLGVTPCGADEWEEAAPTNTTNRKCTKVTTCLAGEWRVSEATEFADTVCETHSTCDSPDLEVKDAGTATADAVCQEIDDCATKGDICDNGGQCFDLGAAMPGQVGCDCSGTGFSGDYCDCQFGTTYSQSKAGLNSPCFGISECRDTQFEFTPPTNSTDRVCRDITVCDGGFYQQTPPTKVSNRVCAQHSPPCELLLKIETAPPTNVSDRQCEDTTSTSTTTTTVTSTTTTTTTTTVTTILYPCELSCINGGKCTLVKADCSDPFAPYDKPVCECPQPAGNKCFYGERCEASLSCDSMGVANSCNPFVQQGRGSVDVASVCKTETWAPDLCSKDQPASADAAVADFKEDTPAEADKSAGAASLVTGAGVAIAMVLLLVGVVLLRRHQEARDEKDRQAFDSYPLQLPVNPKFLTTSTALDQYAASRKTGDFLWNDYKRCASFDHFYYGNKIMQLSDDALVDVYAVLAVKCPPRKYLPSLREVGTTFCNQEVSAATPDISDDVVNFLTSSMPDVLVERALDLFATVVCTLEPNEYGNDALYEAFYAMITDYCPEENQYLEAAGDSRALSLDAASDRDPIYYDINELPADPSYSMGRQATYSTLPGIENPYDLGRQESNDTYAAASSLYEQDEATYDVGQADGYKDLHPYPETAVYDVGSRTSMDDVATYGTASAVDVGGERLYDTGMPTLAGDADGSGYTLAHAGDASGNGYTIADTTGSGYTLARAVSEDAYTLGDAVETPTGDADPLYACANGTVPENQNTSYDAAQAAGDSTYGTATATQVPQSGSNTATYGTANQEQLYDNPAAKDLYSVPVKKADRDVRKSYVDAIDTSKPSQGREHTYSRLIDVQAEGTDPDIDNRSDSYHEAHTDVTRNVNDTYTLATQYDESNADAMDKARRGSAALEPFEKLEDQFEPSTPRFDAGFGAGDSNIPNETL